MSFWKSLFGKAAAPASGAGEAGVPEHYNGYTIRAAPLQADAKYQAAGFIEKEVGGVRKEHHFIRADFFSTHEEAARFSLTKARQIVDLEGDRVFD